MIAKNDIIIRKSILHVLDNGRGDLILSPALLDPGPDLYEFIRSHIYRLLTSDDAKDCEFNKETSPVYSLLASWDELDEDSFIETSQALAGKLYAAMGECLDVPPADLIFTTFQAEEVIYLAMLKMNYRESYTHNISDSGLAGIVKTRALLPTATARIPEAILINLSDFHIKLMEKKYEANGEKINYLSELFLVCSTQLPPKQKLKALTKVINDISNEFDGADVNAKLDTKSVLSREFEEKKAFDVEEIGSILYSESPQKKAAFDERIEKYDLQYDNFTLNNENSAKKLERQTLVTDTGIEITIPMDLYGRKALFDVKTDVTGKSTIIISEISDLILK